MWACSAHRSLSSLTQWCNQVEQEELNAVRALHINRVSALLPYGFVRWLVRKLDGTSKTAKTPKKGRSSSTGDTGDWDMSKDEVCLLTIPATVLQADMACIGVPPAQFYPRNKFIGCFSGPQTEYTGNYAIPQPWYGKDPHQRCRLHRPTPSRASRVERCVLTG